MATDATVETSHKRINWKWTAAICLGILILAVGLIILVNATEPSAQKTGASRKSAMLVETIDVEQGTFTPMIEVLGLVEAREDIILSPRVSGEIIESTPAFTSGNTVQKGDILVKIDPADYENIVAQRRSKLHQAEAALSIEEGRQTVAKLDYELLNRDLELENEALILREPQLNAAKADVEAAQSALEQAQLDLKRTTIRAPFDAQVLSRNVAVGSQVAPGDTLGRLVGLESYWVTATVPLSKLNRVAYNGPDGESGSYARVRNRAAWPKGEYREGRVTQLIGALDEMTRLARVRVEVNDPYSQLPENQGKPPLIIGSVLEVTIEGRPIENVVRLNREYLRENDTVWVKEEGKLRILPVTVAFKDQKYVYLSEGLPANAQVVTSGLSTVVEGAELRAKSEGDI